MLTDDEWAEVDKIPGWLYRAEADCIARYAATPWCEVGAWCGKSTVVLKRGGHGFVVDTFAGSGEIECPYGSDVRDEFDANVGDGVTVHQGDFAEMADRIPSGLRLLYLDAEHSYDGTRNAWSLYSPLVASDGVVLVHDAWGEKGERDKTPWPGVTEWVLEVLERGDWVEVESVRRIAVLRRAA